MKRTKKVLTLGIETSCDETAAAVVENGLMLRSNVVSSQVNIHAKFAGVVPELASRAHIESVNPVIGAALAEAGITIDEIDYICYTRGPGLAGALLVGQIAAQALASVSGKPLIAVNHLEGHFYAALLEHKKLKTPYLSLIVSGGHTELVVVETLGRYRYLGGTRDDAAGEAYDKVAKLLGLPYPGGPHIDRLAAKGNPAAVKFPRPYLWGSWDFSFSGIKTSVVNLLRHAELEKKSLRVEDVCASFQQAMVETLVEKTFAAARDASLKAVVVGGGVAANAGLRAAMLARGKKERIGVHLPAKEFCTDNAAMIAAAGYLRAVNDRAAEADAYHRIEPDMPITNWKTGRRS